jgi:hypothetical protein
MPSNNMANERKVLWAAGNLYEPYVGRWSRLIAGKFLTWLDIPPQSDWLDVGCGTGALTATILQPRFRDFDDYWIPFLGGQGPASASSREHGPFEAGPVR